MTAHRLGGADHRGNGGAGSSPAEQISPKTNNKKILRRMLRSRDKQLSYYDKYNVYVIFKRIDYIKLDFERKLIRHKLKRFENDQL